MIKKYKGTLILTSLLLLIPVVIGLLLWEKLPDQIPSHWGFNGQVDGWSSKAQAVFGFPAILLGVQWVGVLATAMDPKRKNYHPKMFSLMLWFCPALGIAMSVLIYGAALGYELNSNRIVSLILGVLFLIIGNLMPKCRQTYTMGIKLPWTLNSEENWNKTHRFAGKIWVIGGIAMMISALWDCGWIPAAISAPMIILPTAYSYLYYVKHERQEDDHGNN